MDIVQTRDECIQYLKAHEIGQEEIAEEMGISFSWLNKFVCGHANNCGIERLAVVHRWVLMDRERTGRSQSRPATEAAEAAAAASM